MKMNFKKKNEIAGSTIIVMIKADVLQKTGEKKRFRLSRDISLRNVFFTACHKRIEKIVKRAEKKDILYCSAELFCFFFMPCPVNSDIKGILKKLQAHKYVDLAYIEWFIQPPYAASAMEHLYINQGYLQPAPVGINAAWAWRQKGGKGEGHVQFIDIELGWNLEHEGIDAGRLQWTGENILQFREHGTAVLGIIMMQNNLSGRIGITPGVKGRVISQCRAGGYINTPDAVLSATVHLRAGDILLLEAQAIDTGCLKNCWPLEIHTATYAAIRLATALGIIVIEAAGNGSIVSGNGNDLDLYKDINGNSSLDRSDSHSRDSGAVIVGAAYCTVPHERARFSNYGSRVDCYAWGENIATAGSFPQSSGVAMNTYTAEFGGTSGAAAIIAGVAIAVQGIAEAAYKRRLTPAQMRALLRDNRYNTSSANGQGRDKIGVMPDLKKIIEYGLPEMLVKNKKDIIKGV